MPSAVQWPVVSRGRSSGPGIRSVNLLPKEFQHTVDNFLQTVDPAE